MLSARELADRAEIADVIERYFVALDERDWAGLDAVFAPGAALVYDLGAPARSTHPEMLELFRRFCEQFVVTQRPPRGRALARGARAAMTCPGCGGQNRPDARCCLRCGGLGGRLVADPLAGYR